MDNVREYTDQEFRDWLVTVDPNEHYNYVHNQKCAYAQFLKAQGVKEYSVLGWTWYTPSQWKDGEELIHYDIPEASCLAVQTGGGGKVPEELRGSTFGLVLKRLDYLMNQNTL